MIRLHDSLNRSRKECCDETCENVDAGCGGGGAVRGGGGAGGGCAGRLDGVQGPEGEFHDEGARGLDGLVGRLRPGPLDPCLGRETAGAGRLLAAQDGLPADEPPVQGILRAQAGVRAVRDVRGHDCGGEGGRFLCAVHGVLRLRREVGADVPGVRLPAGRGVRAGGEAAGPHGHVRGGARRRGAPGNVHRPADEAPRGGGSRGRCAGASCSGTWAAT